MPKQQQLRGFKSWLGCFDEISKGSKQFPTSAWILAHQLTCVIKKQRPMPCSKSTLSHNEQCYSRSRVYVELEAQHGELFIRTLVRRVMKLLIGITIKVGNYNNTLVSHGEGM